MFLAMTGDARIWPADSQIALLGEWCRRHELIAEWRDRDCRLIPYHWDDRKKLKQDYRYLLGFYEKILPVLAESLNGIHGASYSTRYWKILIGPWFLTYLTSLFDRYSCILSAESSGDKFETIVWEHKQDARVPASTVDFFRWLSTDLYNDYVFGLILEQRQNIEIRKRGPSLDDLPENERGREVSAMGKWARMVQYIGRKLLPASLSRYCFFSNYIGRIQLFQLQALLVQIPGRSRFNISVPGCQNRPSFRAKLVAIFNSQPVNSEFESFALSSIPKFLPSVFLESYHDYRASVLEKRDIGLPKVILMAGSHYFDEAAKFFCAESVERGAKLIGCQHGGGYGLTDFSCYEFIEADSSDHYLSWGWTGSSNELKIVPGTSPYLKKFGKNLRSNPKGGILWVQNSSPRYSYSVYSAPLGPQFNQYLQQQEQFASILDQSVLDKLTLRLYQQGYWNESARWKARLPNVKVGKDRSILDELRDSRLCICTTNTTTFLEVLSSNFPTVAFWNPEHWEIRPEAREEIDALVTAGILHFSPESAARLVNSIGNCPLEWWLGSPVQEARKIFCQKFARSEGGWLMEWASFFGKI